MIQVWIAPMAIFLAVSCFVFERIGDPELSPLSEKPHVHHCTRCGRIYICPTPECEPNYLKAHRKCPSSRRPTGA
jgi:hypothetical protein